MQSSNLASILGYLCFGRSLSALVTIVADYRKHTKFLVETSTLSFYDEVFMPTCLQIHIDASLYKHSCSCMVYTGISWMFSMVMQ